MMMMMMMMITEKVGKLHNEKLCDLHKSPCIIRTFKRWAGYIARMGRTGWR